jgi:ABC-type multidrug transport system ATPase subunit
MQIDLNQLGRKFGKDWLFRGVSTQFSKGENIAILGPNGSGKSTFLKVLAGLVTPTEGTVLYTTENEVIPRDQMYKHISFSAPYAHLPEDLSPREFLTFHSNFKNFILDESISSILEKSGLSKSAWDKPMDRFSSGMKQRVRVIQGLFSQAGVLFLDEPTTNLDEEGIAWFEEMLLNTKTDTIRIIASNMASDVAQCEKTINIIDYK